MIDRGIPNEAGEWPDELLERLAEWEQGDLVATPPLFYFADPSRAIWSGTREYTESSEGPEVILVSEEMSPPYGVITTQTCDIGEEGRKRPVKPWVQVVPVYEITDSGWKKKLRAGGGPQHWLRIPDLPGDKVWAADLRIEVPVEKSWLAMQERVIGFDDEVAKRAVGARVALQRGRPAFSRDFDALIYRGVHDALDELAEADPDLHDRVMRSVEEVAVQVDSHLEPSTVQIVFLTSEPMDDGCREWLQEWRDGRVSQAEEVGITLQALDFRELESVNVAEYRRMTVIWRKD